ncbi:hypothetical protein PIPA1_30290 [Pelosinus sp. IPA-1]|nr:hypothetical protein PIPA1_30290 [Pelosinus sp. IPA-1]
MFYAFKTDTGISFIPVGWESRYPNGIPTETIIITDEQHQEYFNGGQKIFDIVDGQWTYTEPAGPTLDEIKAQAIQKIKDKRNELEEAGFEYQGKKLDSDPISSQRISLAALAAQSSLAANQPFSLEWTCADNKILTLDAEGVIGMSVALAKFSNQLHVTARDLKDKIMAATTSEEVAKIQE